MRIPLSWLKEYIEINLPPFQIAKILTSLGLEVDAMESPSLGFEKVVVGKVTAVAKHPNADKLCLATVFDGIEYYQVVCGAPNCRPGIKTAFAPVGASLTDEHNKTFKVKSAKLRGIESFGMLCSGKELGLSSDRDGIMEFADQILEGTNVADLYSDTIFEISFTPNLGHCMNLIGIARELSASLEIPVKYPHVSLHENDQDPIQKNCQVTILDKTKCPRYACRLIRNVTVGPSPEWLKNRLEAAGLRSVNNIVDITNFVLLEMGQPLHAFDFDQIEGHEIVVRTAKEGEKFLSLDGKERSLTQDDLLICDRAKGVAIAGVMGGQNSEVSAETQNILIESAYFQPSSIRRTSKRLGLQTDASKRFERGSDPNATLLALDRATSLIQKIAGGSISQGTIDVKEHPFLERSEKCRLNRLNNLLGTHLSVTEVESILKRLGFYSTWDGKDTFTIKIPTYRSDIQAEIDLIEEVARLYGYDNIPKRAVFYHGTMQPHAPLFLFERKVRSRLLSEGLQEFLTCDLIGPTLLNIVQNDVMPAESIVKVLNPTSIEQSVLRTSLLPGLLQAVKYNFDHQNQNIKGFEIGRIHFKKGDNYTEQTVAGIILFGKERPYHWDPKPREVDFYDLKGIVENLLSELGVENVSFRTNLLKIFHAGRQAAIFSSSLEIGSLGEIHPEIQRRLDVPQRILFAEINLHDIFKVQKKEIKMKEIPIFPSSDRDWTVTLKEKTPIEEVLRSIRSIQHPLLEKVEFTDIYRSEKLGLDKKNATFHFVYRDKEKTIEQDVVEQAHQKLTNETLKLLNNSQ